jgi:hypothetical protein
MQLGVGVGGDLLDIDNNEEIVVEIEAPGSRPK